MKILFCILFGILISFGNCNSTQKYKPNKVKFNFCKLIDTLVDENKKSSSNFLANQIIPVLIKESGIDANCSKGFFGYFYFNDSLFDADVEKWRKYFKCK